MLQVQALLPTAKITTAAVASLALREPPAAQVTKVVRKGSPGLARSSTSRRSLTSRARWTIRSVVVNMVRCARQRARQLQGLLMWRVLLWLNPQCRQGSQAEELGQGCVRGCTAARREEAVEEATKGGELRICACRFLMIHCDHQSSSKRRPHQPRICACIM